MKKDYLLYLKKALSVGIMVSSLGLLTACGPDDVTDNDESTFEEEIEVEKDVKSHEHLMVDIGGITYIFRECDETIGKIKVYTSYGSFQLKVYDEKDDLVLDHRTYSEGNITYVNNEKQEIAIQEFEETAIENDAVVYKIARKN